jgi:hypothetical protein
MWGRRLATTSSVLRAAMSFRMASLNCASSGPRQDSRRNLGGNRATKNRRIDARARS